MIGRLFLPDAFLEAQGLLPIEFVNKWTSKMFPDNPPHVFIMQCDEVQWSTDVRGVLVRYAMAWKTIVGNELSQAVKMAHETIVCDKADKSKFSLIRGVFHPCEVSNL